jgi:hypothetical protein
MKSHVTHYFTASNFILIDFYIKFESGNRLKRIGTFLLLGF